MEISKNGNEIRTVENWFTFAPPKRGGKHWKDYRSAKEIARLWTESPTQAAGSLQQLLRPVFGEVALKSAEPELEIRIDSFHGEHRNCDLVIRADSGGGELCIHVEAKADEPFSDGVGEYYRANLDRNSKIPARIDNLVLSLFGCALTPQIGLLRYQLLHATYAAYKDAVRTNASAAVCIVWEFRSAQLSKAKLLRNQNDWNRFLRALQIETPVHPDTGLYGPLFFRRPERQVPIYAGKLTTVLP